MIVGLLVGQSKVAGIYSCVSDKMSALATKKELHLALLVVYREELEFADVVITRRRRRRQEN